MKQNPLLNLLTMQPPTAAPRSGPKSAVAREEFSQALTAAAPAVRQATRDDQPRGDAVSARSASGASPDRSEVAVKPTANESTDADPPAPVVAESVGEGAEAEESILAAWQSLDATEQQEFINELNRLLQQLEQGDLEPQAVVDALQQLLHTFELSPGSALITDISTLAQQDIDEHIGKLVQLIQQLAQKLDPSAVTSPANPAPEVVAVSGGLHLTSANQGYKHSREQNPAPLTNGERAATATIASALQPAASEDSAGKPEPTHDKLLTPSLGELKTAEPFSLMAKPFTLQIASLEGQVNTDRSPVSPLAGGVVNIPPAAAPVPSERGFTVQTMVNTLVGQPGWGQEVGQRVTWLVRQNIAEAQLRLDPPDLGPVNVKITVQNDQAQVVFTTHTPGVREALDQSAQRLRELFAEQGLDLVNVDVSDQSEAGSDQAESGQSGGIAHIGDETDEHQQQPMMENRLSMVDHYA